MGCRAVPFARERAARPTDDSPLSPLGERGRGEGGVPLLQLSVTEAHLGRHEGLEFEFNLGCAHCLASVQPREQLLDRFLRLIFAKRADEAVENMLAR